MKCTLFNKTIQLIFLITLFTVSAFAQGKFVYTNNDRAGTNRVSGFSVDANGKLTGLPGSPWDTDGGGGTCYTCTAPHKILTSNSGFLFVANDGGQSVSVFKINAQNGGLSLVAGSPFGVGGNDNDDKALMMALSADEKYLFVANPGDSSDTALFHITSYKIENNGSLTPHPNGAFVSNGRPSDIRTTPDGKFLIIGSAENPEEGVGSINVKKILPDGGLESASYTVLDHQHFPGSTGIKAIEVSNNSKYLYTAMNYDADDVLSGSVTSYRINEDGTVTEIQTYFSDNGHDFSGSLQMSVNGKFLYRVRTNIFWVYTYKANADGTLTKIQTLTGLTDQPWGAAIDADGKHLFTAFDEHNSNDSVGSFNIGANGKLTQVEDSPFHISTDENINSLAVFPPAKPSACEITTSDDITVNNEQGICGAHVKYPAASIEGTDCGEVECSPESGSLFEVGTTVVTCTAKGASEVSFEVTVNDTQAPTIFQQQDIVKSTDPNQCSAVVNFIATASDNCGTANVEVDHPSGSVFPKGTTTVHIQATDSAGNVSNYSFKVTVTDTQSPQISCPADINTNNAPNQCGAVVNFSLPTASDNCPGLGAVICNPPSGAFFPIGVTNVSCSVTDAAGNQSQCSFKVTVNDTQAPQIVCTSDKVAATASPCDSGVVVTYPAPQVSDNCPNNLQVLCTPPSGTIFPVGTTTVTCTVKDGGNNQAQCSFKVTIFNVWLQDDSNPSTVLLFNTNTGEYRLCYPGANQAVTGVGQVTKKGCGATLQHNTAERRVMAMLDAGTMKGTASYQAPPGSLKCTIADKNVLNNTTICQ